MPQTVNTRSRTRMDGVQAPIVPIVGDLIRQVPGTISLGQGVVHYGPPPAAIDAARAARGPTRPPTTTRTAHGLPALVERSGAQAARARTASMSRAAAPSWSPPARTWRSCTPCSRSPSPATRSSCRCRSTSTTRWRFRWPAAAPSRVADRRALPAAPRRASARAHHRSHARHRHHLAEQPDRRRVLRSVAARGQRPVPRSRACTTSPTRPTSTSPTATARHVSPGSFAGADGHTISLYSLSKAYGFAGWRIGYMVYPEHLDVGDAEDPGHDPDLPAGDLAGRGARGDRGRAAPYCEPYVARARRDPRHRARRAARRSGRSRDVPPADGAFYCLLNVQTDIDPMRARRAADPRAPGRRHPRDRRSA